MTQPSVVLIGGPPGAGKTTLGRFLAGEMGWQALTVDDVKAAIRGVSSPERLPATFEIGRVGPIDYFTHTPPDRMIADSLALEPELWPAVAAVIRRHLALADPIVIDWWLLSPRRIADMNDDRVAAIWIHVAPEALGQRERNNWDFFGASDEPERMYQNFMARSLWSNEETNREASELGLFVLEQPGSRSVADLAEEARRILRLTPPT